MPTTKAMRTCRTIGHAWYPYDAERRPRFGWLVVLRCERCEARRDDLVDRQGYLLSRAYNYAPGYRDADLAEGNRADRRAWLAAEMEKPTPTPRASRGVPRGRVVPIKAAS